MVDRLRITVNDGKYTVVMSQNGGLYALRYGEPWRDCIGDGLILALAQEVEELRDKNQKLLLSCKAGLRAMGATESYIKELEEKL
jgi:hypothetical protein